MDHEPGRSRPLRLHRDEQFPRLRPMTRAGPVRSRIRIAGLFPRERLRTEDAADDVRARLAQVVRQARDGRRVEERDHGDVVADLLLEPVDQHGPLDRVAAQLEKVVIDADLLHSQHLAPKARQEFLQGAWPGRRRAGLSRAARWAARAGLGGPPCRRGCGARPRG